MYLKKVEIHGFKSFADKTILYFEPGISGIIGPNGCGKSNISDSIRWCFGEQRAKSMRSSNMQEVIFGGTQTRTSTGMAEVSLTFDNSQNILPIDYSEVTVTRKLFRSGESEYFTNKTQCRLKDIRDMFLDTGVGSDGYSIIEQEKVDFLIMAKPENRRELFEEASGIAKYKVRREETLRRLEKIDDDMSRLSDTLAIHKQQIMALDIAAKKAKQYKKYQGDLSKYEIAALVHQITHSNDKINRIKKDLNIKIKEFESNNTFATQLDTEIQNIRLTLDEKNEHYLNINRNLSAIKTHIGVADQIVQNSMQRESEIKAEQEKLKQELIINRDKVANMEEQLKTSSIDDTSLNVQVEHLDKAYKEKQQQYNSIRSKLLELELRENAVRSKLSKLESEKEKQLNSKTELSEMKICLDTDIASLHRMVTRLEDDIEPTNNESEKIESELITANESLQFFEIRREELTKTVLTNEEKIKILENNLMQHKENLASSIARVTTLKEFDQHDPARSSIRAMLSLGDVARGPISSLIYTDDDKYELVASALGEKLNYLVCKTSEKAEQAIKFLKDNGLNRLSFIIADKISDFQRNNIGLPLGYSELIKYLRYKSEDEKIIQFICSNSIVYDDKVYGNAIVQGGGKISFEKPVLIEERIKKLHEKINEIKHKVSSMQSEIDKFNEFQKNSRIEKDKINFDIIKTKTQIEDRYSQVEEKKNNKINIINEIEKHKKEINIKNLELVSFNEKISIFDTKFTEYENEESKLYEELKIIENNIFGVRKEEEFIAPLMMDVRSDRDKKIAEFENMQKGQQYILNGMAAIKDQIQYCENKIVENNKKLTELTVSQETETIKMQELYKEQAQKESEMQISLKDKQSLQDTIDVKTSEWHDLRSKTDILNNEVNVMQVDLKNFEYQKSDLENRLTQAYGKNYEEIKNDFGGVEVNGEEIARIKKKIESLDSVNLAAQEEYDVLDQRYNFLLTQQYDLLKAKDDLHEVMKTINQFTIENFKKTFDIVRRNFKELYVKLFGGGEADLILTDENNLLESGVDIYAQPVGKKLQNISLCSGGEKALTAVALLFAFFMVKPSPFCILDEVDAPLDDANVSRYNSMVKEFSSKTQFLIVTHNKRTMEMVDVLYGVTMEEHGISKIISVKMDKQYQSIAQ
ncbi:MAG: chromosome segregation protein SMC [Endomicrobium sp.]|jgi:chromosome segregation protein|nr:chromosome segregation protein SMC [Endomicrobium sp.]